MEKDERKKLRGRERGILQRIKKAEGGVGCGGKTLLIDDV